MSKRVWMTAAMVLGVCTLTIGFAPGQGRPVLPLDPAHQVPAVPSGRAPIPGIGHVAFPALPAGKMNPPIPGRILVKIDGSELLERFTPPRLGTCEAAWLAGIMRLPVDLRPKTTEFLGLTQDGNMAFRLVFDRQVNRSRIDIALHQPRLRVPADLQNAITRSPDLVVVVTLQRRINDLRLQCGANYYALKSTSALRQAFREIGVVSMRRVFRSAEVPNGPSSRFFHVRKVVDLLEEARHNFPVRAARADPAMTPATGLENWFVLRLDGRLDVAEAISMLEKQSAISATSADFPLRSAAAPNDPEYVNNNQWGLTNTGGGGGLPGFDINIIPAWDDPTPAAPVTVAVVDTGFKEDLDELVDRLWTNSAETAGDGLDNDCNGYVDDVHGITTYDPWRVVYSGAPCTVAPGVGATFFGVHGTDVAGIIAAKTNNSVAVAGTAGALDVRLMNIAVGWCSPGATMASGSAELAEGLLYTLQKGADITNVSLSSYGEPLFLRETIETLLSQGLVVVASAGNDGLRAVGGADPLYFVSPAALVGVIGVGGVQNDGRRWPLSNYGPGLSLVAPAAGVRTITFSSPTQTVAGVTNVTGTSASAAFVSGAAAVVLAKYPQVTAPYMRDWLRATARDIVDPNGTGATLPGHDEWTGAGLLNAGAATTSLANALDQPLAVSILVERDSSCMATPLYDVASGQPDLGITVAGSALDRWWLEYGEGDSPTTWTVVSGISPAVSSQPLDVARSTCLNCSALAPWLIDVASGHNYLDTDALLNRSVYTLKLVAQNLAGRRFETYDWFRPVRAMMDFAADYYFFSFGAGMSLVGRWGWPDLHGFADARPGASYDIRFEREDGSLVVALPSQVASGDPWCVGRGSSRFVKLLGGGSSPTMPTSPALASLADGWYRFALTVHGPTGALDSDSLRVYVDNSHFATRAGWPVPVVSAQGGGYWGVGDSRTILTDMGGGLGRRLFVYRESRLVCLDPAGSVLWTFDLYDRRLFPYYGRLRPTLAVEDVDGDGINEIAVVGTRLELNASGTGYETWNYVFLLKADGTPYNANWPIRFPVTRSGNYESGVPAVYIADVTGDSRKEIIFYEQPINYYGIRIEDIRSGYLHVANLNGQPASAVWPKEFPPSEAMLWIQTGDLDANGKDEILLEPGRVLKGDATYLVGWNGSTGPTAGSALLANILTATATLEVLQFQSSPWASPNYSVTLRQADGSVATGWPLQFSASPGYVSMGPNVASELFVAARQLVAGGNREIVLCYDRIRAVTATGTPITGFPEIDLQGRCEGISLFDVDGDGQLEYIARVARFRDDMPATYRKGLYLEAYKLNGTPLSASDSRWPVVLPPGQNTTVVDFDLDGGVEVINILSEVPYFGGLVSGNSKAEVLTVR